MRACWRQRKLYCVRVRVAYSKIQRLLAQDQASFLELKAIARSGPGHPIARKWVQGPESRDENGERCNTSQEQRSATRYEVIRHFVGAPHESRMVHRPAAVAALQPCLVGSPERAIVCVKR